MEQKPTTRTENKINVILGKNSETDEKQMLGLTVNRKWTETAEQIKPKVDVLIADADRALRNVLIDKATTYERRAHQNRKEKRSVTDSKPYSTP